jgi:hypothetical protein
MTVTRKVSVRIGTQLCDGSTAIAIILFLRLNKHFKDPDALYPFPSFENL